VNPTLSFDATDTAAKEVRSSNVPPVVALNTPCSVMEFAAVKVTVQTLVNTLTEAVLVPVPLTPIAVYRDVSAVPSVVVPDPGEWNLNTSRGAVVELLKTVTR